MSSENVSGLTADKRHKCGRHLSRREREKANLSLINANLVTCRKNWVINCSRHCYYGQFHRHCNSKGDEVKRRRRRRRPRCCRLERSQGIQSNQNNGKLTLDKEAGEYARLIAKRRPRKETRKCPKWATTSSYATDCDIVELDCQEEIQRQKDLREKSQFVIKFASPPYISFDSQSKEFCEQKHALRRIISISYQIITTSKNSEQDEQDDLDYSKSTFQTKTNSDITQQDASSSCRLSNDFFAAIGKSKQKSENLLVKLRFVNNNDSRVEKIRFQTSGQFYQVVKEEEEEEVEKKSERKPNWESLRIKLLRLSSYISEQDDWLSWKLPEEETSISGEATVLIKNTSKRAIIDLFSQGEIVEENNCSLSDLPGVGSSFGVRKHLRRRHKKEEFSLKLIETFGRASSKTKSETCTSLDSPTTAVTVCGRFKDKKQNSKSESESEIGQQDGQKESRKQSLDCKHAAQLDEAPRYQSGNNNNDNTCEQSITVTSFMDGNRVKSSFICEPRNRNFHLKIAILASYICFSHLKATKISNQLCQFPSSLVHLRQKLKLNKSKCNSPRLFKGEPSLLVVTGKPDVDQNLLQDASKKALAKTILAQNNKLAENTCSFVNSQLCSSSQTQSESQSSESSLWSDNQHQQSFLSTRSLTELTSHLTSSSSTSSKCSLSSSSNPSSISNGASSSSISTSLASFSSESSSRTSLTSTTSSPTLFILPDKNNNCKQMPAQSVNRHNMTSKGLIGLIDEREVDCLYCNLKDKSRLSLGAMMDSCGSKLPLQAMASNCYARSQPLLITRRAHSLSADTLQVRKSTQRTFSRSSKSKLATGGVHAKFASYTGRRVRHCQKCNCKQSRNSLLVLIPCCNQFNQNSTSVAKLFGNSNVKRTNLSLAKQKQSKSLHPTSASINLDKKSIKKGGYYHLEANCRGKNKKLITRRLSNSKKIKRRRRRRRRRRFKQQELNKKRNVQVECPKCQTKFPVELKRKQLTYPLNDELESLNKINLHEEQSELLKPSINNSTSAFGGVKNEEGLRLSQTNRSRKRSSVEIFLKSAFELISSKTASLREVMTSSETGSGNGNTSNNGKVREFTEKETVQEGSSEKRPPIRVEEASRVEFGRLDRRNSWSSDYSNSSGCSSREKRKLVKEDQDKDLNNDLRKNTRDNNEPLPATLIEQKNLLSPMDFVWRASNDLRALSCTESSLLEDSNCLVGQLAAASRSKSVCVSSPTSQIKISVDYPASGGSNNPANNNNNRRKLNGGLKAMGKLTRSAINHIKKLSVSNPNVFNEKQGSEQSSSVNYNYSSWSTTAKTPATTTLTTTNTTSLIGRSQLEEIKWHRRRASSQRGASSLSRISLLNQNKRLSGQGTEIIPYQLNKYISTSTANIGIKAGENSNNTSDSTLGHKRTQPLLNNNDNDEDDQLYYSPGGVYVGPGGAFSRKELFSKEISIKQKSFKQPQGGAASWLVKPLLNLGERVRQAQTSSVSQLTSSPIILSTSSQQQQQQQRSIPNAPINSASSTGCLVGVGGGGGSCGKVMAPATNTSDSFQRLEITPNKLTPVLIRVSTNNSPQREGESCNNSPISPSYHGSSALTRNVNDSYETENKQKTNVKTDDQSFVRKEANEQQNSNSQASFDFNCLTNSQNCASRGRTRSVTIEPVAKVSSFEQIYNKQTQLEQQEDHQLNVLVKLKQGCSVSSSATSIVPLATLSSASIPSASRESLKTLSSCNNNIRKQLQDSQELPKMSSNKPQLSSGGPSWLLNLKTQRKTTSNLHQQSCVGLFQSSTISQLQEDVGKQQKNKFASKEQLIASNSSKLEQIKRLDPFLAKEARSNSLSGLNYKGHIVELSKSSIELNKERAEQELLLSIIDNSSKKIPKGDLILTKSTQEFYNERSQLESKLNLTNKATSVSSNLLKGFNQQTNRMQMYGANLASICIHCQLIAELAFHPESPYLNHLLSSKPFEREQKESSSFVSSNVKEPTFSSINQINRNELVQKPSVVLTTCSSLHETIEDNEQDVDVSGDRDVPRSKYSGRRRRGKKKSTRVRNRSPSSVSLLSHSSDELLLLLSSSSSLSSSAIYNEKLKGNSLTKHQVSLMGPIPIANEEPSELISGIADYEDQEEPIDDDINSGDECYDNSAQLLEVEQEESCRNSRFESQSSDESSQTSSTSSRTSSGSGGGSGTGNTTDLEKAQPEEKNRENQEEQASESTTTTNGCRSGELSGESSGQSSPEASLFASAASNNANVAAIQHDLKLDPSKLRVGRSKERQINEDWPISATSSGLPNEAHFDSKSKVKSCKVKEIQVVERLNKKRRKRRKKTKKAKQNKHALRRDSKSKQVDLKTEKLPALSSVDSKMIPNLRKQSGAGADIEFSQTTDCTPAKKTNHHLLEVPVNKQARSASLDAPFLLKVPTRQDFLDDDELDDEDGEDDDELSYLSTGGQKSNRSRSVDISLPTQPGEAYTIRQQQQQHQQHLLQLEKQKQQQQQQRQLEGQQQKQENSETIIKDSANQK